MPLEGFEKFKETYQPKENIKVEGFDPEEMEKHRLRLQLDEKVAKEKPGLFERIGARLGKRDEETKKVFAEYAEPAMEGDVIAQMMLLNQVGGKLVAGGALDIVGETVIEGLKQVGEGIKLVTPKGWTEEEVEGLKKAWKMLTETETGKSAYNALIGGMDSYKEFKKENPVEANMLEGAVNIGLLLAPAPKKAKADPSVFGVAQKKSGKAAAKQMAMQKRKFVQELVRPIKTPAEALKQVPRTTEKGVGPFKRKVTELSAREKEAAKELMRVPGVTGKKSIQHNYNKITEANTKLAIKLERDVAKSKAAIPIQESAKAIDDAIDDLIKQSPLLTGIPEKTARKFAEGAQRMLAEQPSTALGVLKARKAFDKMVREQKTRAFDPKHENITSAVTRRIRDTMNNLVDKAVKTTKVSRELTKQRNIYNALEIIAPKAAKESNYAIGRSIQNIVRVLPFNTKLANELSLISGLGAFGVTAKLAPTFAGGILGTAALAKGGKMILGPGTKQNMGRLMKLMDRAIITSKKPSMIKQLRSDRALILEMLKEE